MPLAAGSRLGAHEIQGLLGAGGMGEVYLALDTRLHRRVAIKVLPAEYAADADRLARFEREAHAVAALNHPHVATIHDFAQDGATRYLVLELVDGPTLADRIQAGPMPVDEAIAIGSQILQALEAAHARGICHRDLKPANIKLTPDGSVKVLDFGLAKIRETPGTRPEMTNSPTMALGATHPGVVMGTAGYMSPEQAKGFEADARSDIFSFGCVFYELVTGRRAFEGETSSEILAAVIKSEVDWTRLPAGMSPRLVAILQRCLEKNPKRRWHGAADLRMEMEASQSALPPVPVTPEAPPAPRPWWRRALPAAAGGLVGAAAVALLTPSFGGTPTTPARSAIRLSIPVPAEHVVRNGVFLAISPDGTRIAYASSDGRLFLRSLDRFESTQVRVAGPESFYNLTFAPDGRQLAFTDGRRIYRIPTDGGAVSVVGELPRGAGQTSRLSWGEGGLLVAGAGGIFRFQESGGPGEQIVTLAPTESAASPQLLPGGDAVLFTLGRDATRADWGAPTVVVQSVTTGKRTVVVEGGADGRYLPSGHVVYAMAGSLFAVAFDLQTLKPNGSPATIVTGVRRAVSSGAIRPEALAATSATGTLAYVPGPAEVSSSRSISMIDREGREQPLPIPRGSYESPRVSPDGRLLAYGSDDGRDATVWVYDLSGVGAPRRLTFAGRNRYPVWSPDSRRLAFQSDREGDAAIFVQNADGTGEAERLTRADADAIHMPESWARRGDLLSYSVLSPSGAALWTVSTVDRKAAPFGGVTGYGPLNSAFSPDGRWMAYTSRGEPFGVFVQPVPATGARYQVSTTTETGHHPFWSPDGKELFYLGAERGARLVGVQLIFGSGVTAGRGTVFPRTLITNTSTAGPSNYEMTPDGRFFVGTRGVTDELNAVVEVIHVVLNWADELKQLVPVP